LGGLFNNPHCLTLNSGTAGLRLALELLKSKKRYRGRGKVIVRKSWIFKEDWRV